MMTPIPRAARRDKHLVKCEIVLSLWNEAVASGGMVTPGIGKLVKIDAPRGGFPITVIDEQGRSRDYDDSLRSLYEQLTGNPGEMLEKAAEA